MLDNVPHIKAYWIMLGIGTAQIALCLRGRRHRRHGAARADLPRRRRHDARDSLGRRDPPADHRSRPRAGRTRHALPPHRPRRRSGRPAKRSLPAQFLPGLIGHGARRGRYRSTAVPPAGLKSVANRTTSSAVNASDATNVPKTIPSSSAKTQPAGSGMLVVTRRSPSCRSWPSLRLPTEHTTCCRGRR